MAKKSIINSNLKKKGTIQYRKRCNNCGRPRGYMALGLCRVCFRNLASAGKLPGIKKASW